MMRLAFYAPLKPPNHPTPSGDRAMARALMQALELGGAEVTLASELRSYDGQGDQAAQALLQEQAETEVARLIPVGRALGWRAWVTYHSYYKAPDMIGPAVARALDIPYLLIEATRAAKRLTGPWATFATAAEYACDAAQVIFYLTLRDGEALLERAPAGQRIIHLRPFLARRDLPPAASLDGPMLSVGMLRTGDKLASYRLIADTLPLLKNDEWTLEIAGGGTAQREVETLMAPLGTRVRFLGLLDPVALQGAYSQSSLLFWPGVNEAFGLVYLEAQAVGLPVVAQDRPGVRDVLAHSPCCLPDSGPPAMASALDALLGDRSLRRRRGAEARAHVAAHHLIDAASRTLATALREVAS